VCSIAFFSTHIYTIDTLQVNSTGDYRIKTGNYRQLQNSYRNLPEILCFFPSAKPFLSFGGEEFST